MIIGLRHLYMSSSAFDKICLLLLLLLICSFCFLSSQGVRPIARLLWDYGWEPGTGGRTEAAGTPWVGGWHHAAMTSDDAIARIYVDGQLVASDVPSAVGGDLRGLSLCTWQYGGGNPYLGTLDEFR